MLIYDNDIIIVLGTWLNNSIGNEEIISWAYIIYIYIYKKKRNSVKVGKSRGGKVLVAAKSIFQATVINETVENQIEELYIRFKAIAT